MSQRSIEISELNQMLDTDPDGVQMKLLIDRLLAGKQRSVRALNRGVGKDEFARLTSLAAAYDAGVEALPKLWASIRENPNS